MSDFDRCFTLCPDKQGPCEIVDKDYVPLHEFLRANFSPELIIEYIDTIPYINKLIFIKIRISYVRSDDPLRAALASCCYAIEKHVWEKFSHEEKVAFMLSLHIPGIVGKE